MQKYHVLVVSDEIHCDITKPGISYIPFASVSDVCRDNCITCVAPTKTFNIAGIQTAAVIVADENIRHRVITGLETENLAETNVLRLMRRLRHIVKVESGLTTLENICGKTGSLQKNL